MKINEVYYSPAKAAVAMVIGLSAILFTGCGDTEIKTYRVAKEDSSTPVVHTHAGAPMGERPALPHLHSKVPEGWKELPPEKMRVASYQISGGEGQMASVSVIPLPGASKIELQSVNMWREELGLGALSSEQLKEQAQTVDVGDSKGMLVDLAGEAAGGGTPARTIGALAERGGIMWFIKMTGAASVVGQQKENFVAYLKSLEFHEGSHGPAAEPTQVASAEKTETAESSRQNEPAATDGPNFKAPENWEKKAPGPMVTSAYALKGDGTGEVTVSKFPGDVGGMVANINRWRGQLGLSPLAEAEARKAAEMIEVGGKKDSYLVDIKGTNARTGTAARMVAVGVPHGGQTWFFKLLGDEALVAKEKDAFVRFIVGAY